MTALRGAALGVVLLTTAATLPAQQPTVSPALTGAFAGDTTRAVWLFARPQIPLARVRALVAAAGGHVRRTSRWLHAVSADLDARAFARLRLEPGLRHLQPVARYVRRTVTPPDVRFAPQPGAAPLASPTPGPDSAYGPSAMPFRALNLFPLATRGFDGSGVTIAIFDAGFETELATFAGADVAAQYDFVFNDSIVREQPQDTTAGGSDDGASMHGTAVWSLLGGRVTDSLIGIATGARYLLAKTEDIRSETAVEEDNYVAALEWADSLGASVVSSSLGYLRFDNGTGYTFSQLNGDVAVTTVAADAAAARGITVVTAMGNAGPSSGSLDTPADGDSVISVGAVDSADVLAAFSSRGPTADGRIKPDVTAPGVGIWVRVPDRFGRYSGTSFSTPITAGGVVLMKQIHPTFGPIDIRNALRAAGSHAADPDAQHGWGTPDVTRAATFPGGVIVSLPADTLFSTVTPRFDWSAADVPAFASPVTYRLRLAADTSFQAPLLDTTLTTTSYADTAPLKPGTRLAVEVTATAADSVTVTVRSPRAYVVPAWATLTGLDDPAGSTIRDVRPTLSWTSPAVTNPPGPFVYRVRVARADDGSIDASVDSVTATSWVPDHDLERNTPYRWSVVALLGADSTVTTSRGTFLITDDTKPAITTLFQNFPNPFPDAGRGQLTTCFWFDLANSGNVRLDVLDLRGHLVRRLFPVGTRSGYLAAGRYGRPAVGASTGCDPAFAWDGVAADGSHAPRGVYLAELATPDGTFFKRVVFLGD